MNFDEAKTLFKNDQIEQLAETSGGLRFLKLRTLSRKEHLEQLFRFANIQPKVSKVDPMFRQIFDAPEADTQTIENSIRKVYFNEREGRKNLEPQLVSELYKIQVFDWGGLHNNSLEGTIVDQYVKKITDFDTLSGKVENELHHSMRGYVLCSWYNHWTSIIIEDIFQDHSKVLPAVGKVKKIDFFINDVPFDLKVTYLPEGYISNARKEDRIRPELTLLKRFAKRNSIHFDKGMSNSRLLQDLWAQIRDLPYAEAQNFTSALSNYRTQLLRNSENDPTKLIRWLYENQGQRRFDASNRIFLVLVDQDNFFDSWKLKRAKHLLEHQIHSYLDSVGSVPGHRVKFVSNDGTTYNVLSDIVFVIKP